MRPFLTEECNMGIGKHPICLRRDDSAAKTVFDKVNLEKFTHKISLNVFLFSACQEWNNCCYFTSRCASREDGGESCS